MLRLGIVDCDTSHVVQFTRRLNQKDAAPDQRVDGAEVVAAWSGPSRVLDEAKIGEYVETLRNFGVNMVDRPEDMIGGIDAVLVESNEGGVHRQRVEPFLKAGIPAFIDKPFASRASDARAIVGLAKENGVTCLSASSLRFVPEIRDLKAGQEGVGKLLGVDVHSPGSLHPANPGLLHYGVHAVEMLYELMGTGCAEVSCISEQGGDVVTGRWQDGRLGVVRALRSGATGYGYTAYGEQGTRCGNITLGRLYDDLLTTIVSTLSGSPSPVEYENMVEVVAFQEAALASAEAGGKPVQLPTGNEV